jgi:hypothetical protein
MALDAKKLADDIVKEVAATQAKTGFAAVQAVSPADFCGIWAKAKPILDLLSGVVIFIPGAGTTAGAVLKGLIQVGDTIATQMNCK